MEKNLVYDDVEIRKCMMVFDEMEHKMKQMEIQLQIKKSQLDSLRTDFDASQLDKHELRYRHDLSSTTLKDVLAKFNAIKDSYRSLEIRLMKTMEENGDHLRKYTDMKNENKILKDMLHNTQIENAITKRKYEDLESKITCDEVEMQYVKSLISTIQSNVAQMKNEQKLTEEEFKAMNIKMNEITNLGRITKTAEYYNEQLKKVIDEKNAFELKYIVCNSKYETLSKYLNKGFSENESNFFYEQWLLSIINYKRETKDHMEIENNLITHLKQEKEVNVKLIERLHDLEKEKCSQK